MNTIDIPVVRLATRQPDGRLPTRVSRPSFDRYILVWSN